MKEEPLGRQSWRTRPRSSQPPVKKGKLIVSHRPTGAQVARTPNMLEEALAYAKSGFHIFPVHTPVFAGNDSLFGCSCRKVQCTDIGKHPRIKGWKDLATTDEEQIKEWWRKWPKANIGWVPGKSGHIVLDADKYKDHYAGKNALTQEEEETPTSLTGGGGSHLVFRKHDGAFYGNHNAGLPAGIDVRADSGYVLLPPSLHRSGKRYQWETGYAPGDVDVKPLPDRIHDILMQTAAQAPARPHNGSLPLQPTTWTDDKTRTVYVLTHVSDEAVIESIRGCKQAAEIERLMNGDLSDVAGDHSQGVKILAGHLAHHTGHNVDQMVRMLEGSKILTFGKWAQGKWERLKGEVIERALHETPPADKRTVERSAYVMAAAAQAAKDSTAAPHPPKGAHTSGTNGRAAKATQASSNGARPGTNGSAPPPHQSQGKGTATAAQGPSARPSDIIRADLQRWGYRFRLNETTDTIEVNGERITDAIAAQIRTTARDHGYGERTTKQKPSLRALEDTYTTIAVQKAYNPIREYIAGCALRYDGGDHIGKLAGFVTDKHPPIVYPDGTQRSVFHALLERWIVGAVGKATSRGHTSVQNPMLVLEGAQGCGKSTLAAFLLRDAPELFSERPVHPDDKDSQAELCRRLVWEAAELGAVTRKADRESLKAFLTLKIVTVRKAYARYEIEKPAMASFVGTVNPDGSGFLNDPSGSRRFMTVEIEGIDFDYIDAVDPSQLWGQAAAILARDPNAWRLTPEEQEARAEINSTKEQEQPYESLVVRLFEFDSTRLDDPVWQVKSSEVQQVLQLHDVGAQHMNKIGSTLKALGCGSVQRRVNGLRERFYTGLRVRYQHPPGTQKP